MTNTFLTAETVIGGITKKKLAWHSQGKQLLIVGLFDDFTNSIALTAADLGQINSFPFNQKWVMFGGNRKTIRPLISAPTMISSSRKGGFPDVTIWDQN